MSADTRPITMLAFVALIVARWLGQSASDLAEVETLKFCDIVEKKVPAGIV